MFEVWFFGLIAEGIPDLPPFFCVGFWQIGFRIVNKYHVSKKKFQDNAFNLAMQIKQTAQMHLEQWILRRQLANVKEKGLCIYFFKVKRG